jgi:FkbM family methyltransferase
LPSHLLANLLRPITTRLPRGKHILLNLAGAAGTDDRAWKNVPRRHRVFFDKHLQAFIAADLGQWQSRWHFYDGEYGEKDIPLLLRRFLRPGDTFIDIGANFGIHTILGAKLIGDSGRAFAFEPNPQSYDVLKAHLTINGIRNTTAFQIGLGDEAGEFTLAGDESALGAFTLRPIEAGVHLKVQVKRLDDVIDPSQLQNRTLIKVDTEGFEHRVLRGAARLLVYPNLAIVSEVTDAWLRRTGSSAEELISFMKSMGFNVYDIVTRWAGFKLKLDLEPFSSLAGREQCDLFFMKEQFLR